MEWKMTLLNEWEKGRTEGRTEGAILNQIDFIIKKVKHGMELPAIAELLEVEEGVVRPVYDAVKAASPDYDSEIILKRILNGDRRHRLQ